MTYKLLRSPCCVIYSLRIAPKKSSRINIGISCKLLFYFFLVYDFIFFMLFPCEIEALLRCSTKLEVLLFFMLFLCEIGAFLRWSTKLEALLFLRRYLPLFRFLSFFCFSRRNTTVSLRFLFISLSASESCGIDNTCSSVVVLIVTKLLFPVLIL